MTVRTLSEIAATCSKAMRGAGCAWGMAEEAGLAARVLSAHGLPGAEAVAQTVSETVYETVSGAVSEAASKAVPVTVAGLSRADRACPCQGGTGPACGLRKMVGLLDAPPEVETTLGPMAAPLLVLAFGLMEGRFWQITYPEGSALCGPGGVSLTGVLPAAGAGPVTLSLAAPFVPDTAADWRAVEVAPEAWALLERYAACLLVPESETSRTAGAGPDS